MSVLDRYKKPGGFVQLLTLLETCGAAKKEKFLQMIYDENQDWFNALKSRIFTIEMILNWPQEILTELTTRTQPITLTAISKGPFTPEQIQKLQTGLSHAQLAKLRELSENKSFSNIEITSSIEKFLGEIRTHIQHGVIKLEKFAPELAIPSEIEEQLSKKGTANLNAIHHDDIDKHETKNLNSHLNQSSDSQTSISSHSPHSNTGSSGHNSPDDFIAIKKQNQQIQNELQILRNENKLLKDKIEKIRKIV